MPHVDGLAVYPPIYCVPHKWKLFVWCWAPALSHVRLPCETHAICAPFCSPIFCSVAIADYSPFALQSSSLTVPAVVGPAFVHCAPAALAQLLYQLQDEHGAAQTLKREHTSSFCVQSQNFLAVVSLPTVEVPTVASSILRSYCAMVLCFLFSCGSYAGCHLHRMSGSSSPLQKLADELARPIRQKLRYIAARHCRYIQSFRSRIEVSARVTILTMQ